MVKNKVAQALIDSREEILSAWEKQIRKEIFTARKVSPVTLRDSLPEFLEDLGFALEAGMKEIRPDIIRVAHRHGTERAHLSDFSIEDAIHEYNVLRRTIFAVLENKVEILPLERDIIYEGVNIGVGKAGAEYVRQQFLLQHESEKNLRAFFDQAAVGMGRVNLITARWEIVNSTFSKMLGRTKDEILSGTWTENVYPDDKLLDQDKFKDMTLGNVDAYSIEKRFIRNDESIVWVRITLSLIRSDDGSPHYGAAVIEDITDLRKSDEALKESESLFRTLANALPQIIWTATPDFTVDWYNDWWYKYLDLPRGTEWTDEKTLPMHPDDVKRTIPILKECVKTGQSLELEQRFKRGSDGEYRWHLVRGVAIRDQDGKIMKWVGANTDIHDLKMLQRNLEEESLLRDKFVSTLSHDLRTPLTAAKMSADLIRRRPDQIPSPMLPLRIIESLNRANDMIEDLLDASKIRVGEEITLHIEKIDLVEVIEKTIDDLSTIHGNRFQLDAPKKFEAWLCPNGIRRILENLCSNAIKYGSPHEPVCIILHPGHSHLSLCVENKGHPLMTIDKDKLFEPFQRGNAREIAGKKGWGIGLTVVKGITKAHDGEVDVSTSKDGTTFKIILPIDSRRSVQEESRPLQ